jgi:urease accessory protein
VIADAAIEPLAASPMAVEKTDNSQTGRHGSARLVLRSIDGPTRIVEARAHSPLRILSPRNPGSGAWVYTSTFGGGLLGGDQITLTVDAGPDTLTYLGTQSATKVFRPKSAATTRQTLEARVDENALLLLLPDPTACFAGARFHQSQRVDLGKTGSVILLDWTTSGRHAVGERWAAEECLSRNEIWRDSTSAKCNLEDTSHFSGHPWATSQPITGKTFSNCLSACIVRDAIRLPPIPGSVGMGYFNCFATLIMQGPRVAADAARLLDLLKSAPVKPGNATPFGISPVGDGLILRAAGPNAESVARAIFPLLDFLKPVLGEAPWTRKW